MQTATIERIVMDQPQLLTSASVKDLLDELKTRGFDAIEIRDRLEGLVEYVHDNEIGDENKPWPSVYTEGEAALRRWDSEEMEQQ